MFQNRFHRILFFTFTAIIFTFYCFYSNEVSTPYREYFPSFKSLVVNNYTRVSLNQLIAVEEVNIFLEYSKKISIDPFLVEPFLLYNYLNEENQTYFINYNLNPNVFKWKYDFNAFGLKAPTNLTKEETDYFFENICNNDLLKQSDLECTKFYGDNNTREWHLGEKIEWTKEQIPVSFLFNYKPNNHKIHLVLFYLRTQSLWTGKINNTAEVNDLIRNEGANFKFGLYEELFDNFDFIRPIRDVAIPEDPLVFLMEKNNSRLIECDREMATNYYEKYSNKDFKRSKFVRKSLTNIYYFKEMMKDYKMPFWMSSGTLLGWYRQCNIISYTTDIDFAADSRFASEEMTKNLMGNKYNFKFVYVWGIVQNGYEYSMIRGGYKADLFFVYPAEDNKVAIFGHTRSSYNRYFYPKFDLCTGQLRGVRLNVPCNAKDLLELEYGKDWVKPVSSWNYISSPQNKGPTEYWPKGLITFRQYG